jgi:pilus assembly protein FimV
MPATEATAEMPAPAIDQPSAGLDVRTSELPSLEKATVQADADATAEINLDELDLDVDGFDETEVASLDDLDATGQNETLSDTGINEALGELDVASMTGSIPGIDPASTGVDEETDVDQTEFIKGIDISEIEETGMRLAADETGQNPLVTEETEQEAMGLDIDDSLLEATGLTQVLNEDMSVETASGIETELLDSDATMLAPDVGDDKTIQSLPEDAETMLAPMDDDEEDFDFAKTENLPPEVFTTNLDMEATVETPAIAGTDVDLDLDDLTAALKVSEIGDMIAPPVDDATAEQPRPTIPDAAADAPTMELAPDDMSGDLHEARTMTEVGTKLDLARAYVDMGDPAGARSILDEVLDEGDEGQKQQAQALLDSLP